MSRVVTIAYLFRSSLFISFLAIGAEPTEPAPGGLPLELLYDLEGMGLKNCPVKSPQPPERNYGDSINNIALLENPIVSQTSNENQSRGRLKITGRPSAIVHWVVDEEERSVEVSPTRPFRVVLKPGTYVFRFEHDMFCSITKSVTLTAGEDSTVEMDFFKHGRTKLQSCDKLR